MPTFTGDSAKAPFVQHINNVNDKITVKAFFMNDPSLLTPELQKNKKRQGYVKFAARGSRASNAFRISHPLQGLLPHGNIRHPNLS
jgi:hypothetical protein